MTDNFPVSSVKIEGIETVDTVQVVDVEDDDRLIDKAVVVFDDVDGIAAATMLEQRLLTIELGWSDSHAKVFEGVIWRAKTQAWSAGRGLRQRVTLTALDLSCKANQGPVQANSYPPGKLSDVLQSIIAPYGIPVGQIKIDNEPEFTANAPLTRGPRTDWAFIQELAVRYGARAFVEINNDKSQFYFVSEKFFLDGDSVGQITYTAGPPGPLLDFTFQRVAGGAAPLRLATLTDPLTGQTVQQQAGPPPTEDPLSVNADVKSRLDQLGAGAGAVYADAVDAISKSAGTATAARPKENVVGLPSDPVLAAAVTQQDPTRALGLIGEGTAVGNVNLRAKSKLTIQGIAPWAEGDWYVRRVNHRVTRGPGVDSRGRPKGMFLTHFAVTR
jgi:hypothetical protein